MKSVTIVIFQDESSGRYIGIAKEIQGVVISGSTIDEVMARMPKAVTAMSKYQKDQPPRQVDRPILQRVVDTRQLMIA